MKLKFKSKFNHSFTIIIAVYNMLFEKLYAILTLLVIGLFFRGCSWIGGTKKAPIPKICLTYPTIVTLLTFFESLKVLLIMVEILMMSTKLATVDLLKIKVF